MMRRFLKNCRKPEGFIGRMVVSGMNGGHSAISKWGLANLKVSADAHVLDIGCGGGANIERLLQMCSKGHITGIDYSKESVAISRKKNDAEIGKRCEIEQGSVSALPYENDSFDAVTAFETVYFWPDITNDFSEVFRVLKPGGQFLICNELCDPSDTTWSNKIDGMRIYGLDELAHLLLRSGFTIDLTKNKGKTWGCIIAKRSPL